MRGGQPTVEDRYARRALTWDRDLGEIFEANVYQLADRERRPRWQIHRRNVVDYQEFLEDPPEAPGTEENQALSNIVIRYATTMLLDEAAHLGDLRAIGTAAAEIPQLDVNDELMRVPDGVRLPHAFGPQQASDSILGSNVADVIDQGEDLLVRRALLSWGRPLLILAKSPAEGGKFCVRGE
jgi:hypothetical protein